MEWGPRYLGAAAGDEALVINDVQVATAGPLHLGTGWHCSVDRHLAWELRKHAQASDQVTARRWVEAWARRELTRLERETAAIRARWLGRFTTVRFNENYDGPLKTTQLS